MASDEKRDDSFSGERRSLPYEARLRDNSSPFRSNWRLAIIELIICLALTGLVGVTFFYLSLWWHGAK